MDVDENALVKLSGNAKPTSQDPIDTLKGWLNDGIPALGLKGCLCQFL